MLFDPFEEQLDLPTAAIQLRYGQWRQAEIVGQKDESSIGLRIAVANAPQLFGITFAGHWIDERHDLIADHASSAVHRLGIEALKIETFFRPGYKESSGEMQLVQAREIEVAAIHHIEGAGLEAELVQNVDLVNLAMCNDHNSWDVAVEVQQGMQFDRS